jgi:hypothetical protein
VRETPKAGRTVGVDFDCGENRAVPVRRYEKLEVGEERIDTLIIRVFS